MYVQILTPCVSSQGQFHCVAFFRSFSQVISILELSSPLRASDYFLKNCVGFRSSLLAPGMPGWNHVEQILTLELLSRSNLSLDLQHLVGGRLRRRRRRRTFAGTGRSARTAISGTRSRSGRHPRKTSGLHRLRHGQRLVIVQERIHQMLTHGCQL